MILMVNLAPGEDVRYCIHCKCQTVWREPGGCTGIDPAVPSSGSCVGPDRLLNGAWIARDTRVDARRHK